MAQDFDEVKALGEIPASHAKRLRYLGESTSAVLGSIDFGVLFVMAFWSVHARIAFARLKDVLVAVDSEGRLELVVIDTDGVKDLANLPADLGSMSGAGQVAWVKGGRVKKSTGRGFRQEVFEEYTREFLEETGGP